MSQKKSAILIFRY